MDEDIQMFEAARNYLLSSVGTQIECFLTGIWDPLMKYVIVRETSKIINEDLSKHFPNLQKKYHPKCRFRIFEEHCEIECGVQYFFNDDTDLTFLGYNEFGQEQYDFYFRESWDPRFDYIFYARFGHDRDSVLVGSKEAEAEYYLGIPSPLSTAYGLALEDGFIK